MGEKRILKCKFCNYKIYTLTGGDGLKRSQFNLVFDHVFFKHPDEYDKICKMLECEMLLESLGNEASKQ